MNENDKAMKAMDDMLNELFVNQILYQHMLYHQLIQNMVESGELAHWKAASSFFKAK